MTYLSGLVGFLLLLTAEARVGNSSQLEFCSETKQCLLFDRVCDADGYEVRKYGSVKWVSTDEMSFFMEIAAMRAFRRLFNYIDGANKDGKKIEMTAPVIIKMIEGTYFWKRNTYTMSFLLPTEHQANPPKPTDDKVYFQKTPDMKVYSLSYGGWLTNLSDKNKASTLSALLDAVSAEYKKGFHYAVRYNSPMKILNGHNEVWYVVEDDPVCAGSDEDFSPVS